MLSTGFQDLAHAGDELSTRFQLIRKTRISYQAASTSLATSLRYKIWIFPYFSKDNAICITTGFSQQDDGLHFRQPWVIGVEEEVLRLRTEVDAMAAEIAALKLLIPRV